jgi:multiple sugar transport system ATP-binding protein
MKGVDMTQVMLENVTKVYEGKVTAVKDASLSVADREFVVIVGPSGCGKTTTLRMIAGLEEITNGTIRIGDRIVNNIPPKDRDIAMVFQNYALYPHMTVFENMAFGLKLRKYPKTEIKSRVLEAARFLELEPYLARKPKALSGGQRQRVAVGRAIVRNPKAFLFDEPLSNLDAKLRVTTRTELKSLHNRLGATSIYVTHDQAEAMTLGDRICLMYDGRIQQVAPPMEVYDRPVNRFVAGFLGTPPMNFFEGKIRFQREKVYFALEEDSILLPDSFKNKLAGYKDKQMILGIRPEALSATEYSSQSGNSLQAVVDVIEPLGDRTAVHLVASGRRFVASIEPHIRLDMGAKTVFHLDLNRVHIFEPGELGRNVSI